MNFVTPSGFRDVLTDEAVLREQAAQAVQANMAAKGYLPVETPTLEVMDVMRAGGHMTGVPFKFFDSQGDLLAMRPDVTLHPIDRWVRPEEFDELAEEARELGFAGVLSGPLVRSSYRAGRLYRQAIEARAALPN